MAMSFYDWCEVHGVEIREDMEHVGQDYDRDEAGQGCITLDGTFYGDELLEIAQWVRYVETAKWVETLRKPPPGTAES